MVSARASGGGLDRQQGQCPLSHISFEAHADGEPCLLDQLAAPEVEPSSIGAKNGLALRQAAERLEVSCMSVQRAQKMAIAALRQQVSGGG
jgi:hypothetical protein